MGKLVEKTVMQIIYDKNCIIGEGPIWNEEEEKLYFTNSMARELLSVDLKTMQKELRILKENVAALAFCKDGRMLVSRNDGAFILNQDDSITPIYDMEKYQILYGNDAKVGPDGCFYVGTQSEKRMGISEKVNGKLYRIAPNGRVSIVLDGLILSNGFDWSMDEKKVYHTDSDTHIIKEYDFDIRTGDFNYTGRSIQIQGVDGITIDRNDRLYAACWGQEEIAVIDTKSMNKIDTIKVPVQIPASCAFAGKELNELVIVTASYGLQSETLGANGYTFLKKMHISGRAPYLFG